MAALICAQENNLMPMDMNHFRGADLLGLPDVLVVVLNEPASCKTIMSASTHTGNNRQQTATPLCLRHGPLAIRRVARHGIRVRRYGIRAPYQNLLR